MLSRRENEVLQFIREFEVSSMDYLKSLGLSDKETTDAYLQLQWEFLHTIMRRHPPHLTHKPNVYRSGKKYKAFCI